MELTEGELDTVIEAISKALQDRLLTREELAVEVARLTGVGTHAEKLRQSWGLLMKPPSFLGHLCFAPNAGRNVRFTSPRTWLPGYRRVDEDVAEIEVGRRYFAAYGPATRLDLAHWWGISPRAAGDVMKRLGSKIMNVSVEGAPAWILAKHSKEITHAEPVRAVRLLPAFDPYVIAASPHASNLLPGDFKARIYRPQGWLSPVLLIDGRMDGTWTWARKGRSVVVEIVPFVRIARWAAKAAEREAHRLAAYLGGTLDLRWQGP
jgi:hypothetical protein